VTQMHDLLVNFKNAKYNGNMKIIAEQDL
jgi:hypothetical protein